MVGARHHDTVQHEDGRALNGVLELGAKNRGGGAPRWFGQGRRIAGLALGDDGAPLAGASVHLASKLTMAGLLDEPSVLTDGSGHFDLGPQPVDTYVLVAEMPRLTGALASIDLRDLTANPPPDQLRLILHACDASIHGVIHDAAGGVVPKARVSRKALGITPRAGAEADNDGTYELCVPVGGAELAVQAEGYAALSADISAYGRMRRDFSLTPGTTVIGRVVRASDHASVSGAALELHPGQLGFETQTLSTVSDSEGRFQFDGVSPGRHTITAVADRLATAHPVDVVAELGKPQEEVVCTLTTAFSISGKVIAPGSARAGGGASRSWSCPHRTASSNHHSPPSANPTGASRSSTSCPATITRSCMVASSRPRHH